MKRPKNLLALLLVLALGGALRAQGAYCIDANTDELYTFDYEADNGITLVGSTLNNGLASPSGLTWRRVTQQLWTVDRWTGVIGTLDQEDATFTPVYATGGGGWEAIAWHERDKRFYLVKNDWRIYAFDVATGATALLGDPGIGGINCLDTDPDGELFGITLFGAVVSIDRATGAATQLSQSVPSTNALAIDPVTGRWYTFNSSSQRTSILDPATGALSESHLLGLPLFLEGMEFPERRIDAYLLQGRRLYACDNRAGLAWYACTLDGSVGAPQGITYVPSTGELWVLDAAADALGTIDPRTGAYTLRHVLPAMAPPPAPFSALEGFYTAVAWDRVREVFHLTFHWTYYFTFDPATQALGGATPISYYTPSSDVADIDIDEFGQRYSLSMNLVSADLERGGETLYSVPGVAFAAGLAIDQRSSTAYVASRRLTGCDLDETRTFLVGDHGVYPFSIGNNLSYTILNLHEAFAVDADSARLGTVDLDAGSAYDFAAVDERGLAEPSDLAYDDATDDLWVLDRDGGEIGTLHQASGEFRPEFDTGLSGLEALAWDGTTGRFYLADGAGDVYALDRATGVTTLLGSSGVGGMHALDVDAAGDLYGVAHATGALVLVDKATGAATVVATTLTELEALAIDGATGDFYGVRGADDSLYVIDPANGASTLVGPLGPGFSSTCGFEILDSFRRPAARMMSFGVACAGVDLTAQEPPRISQPWQIELSAPQNAVVGMVLVGQKGSIQPTPLGPLAPGCTQFVTVANALLYVAPFGPFGSSNHNVNLPLSPELVGNELAVQGLALVPGANPFGLGFSSLIVGRVGW